MERILVFSDTHGQINCARDIIKSIPDVTGIIHLGDILGDVYKLEKEFDNIPFYYVSGNNDFFTGVESEKMVVIGNIRIFITHGHRYIRNFSNIDSLIYKALEENASIVLFGHTHSCMYKETDGMIVANPGSTTYPRGSCGGYGIIEIEDGKASYANIPLEHYY